MQRIALSLFHWQQSFRFWSDKANTHLGNIIKMKDFGNKDYSGDCFELAGRLYGLSYKGPKEFAEIILFMWMVKWILLFYRLSVPGDSGWRCLPALCLPDRRAPAATDPAFCSCPIPFEEIKLHPLVAGTDESPEQVPSLSVMPLMQVALPCASATCNSPVRSSSFSRVGNCDAIRLIVARK